MNSASKRVSSESLVSALRDILYLDEEKAYRIIESGALDRYTEQQSLTRIKVMSAALGPSFTAILLVNNPYHIRRQVTEIEKRIKRLVLDEGYSLSDTQSMFVRNMQIADVGNLDFECKLEQLKRIVIDPSLRRSFIVAHPEFFLLDIDYLEKKKPVHDANDVDSARRQILHHADGRLATLMDFDTPPKPELPRTVTVRPPPPPTPLPPAPPPPEPESSPTRPEPVDVDLSRAQLEAPTERLPSTLPPSTPDIVPDFEKNPDEICRLLLIPQSKGEKQDASEEKGIKIRSLVDFLIRHVGFNRDMAHPFVVYRKWLIDTNAEATLEELERIGVKANRLYVALRDHTGLLALGHWHIRHVLSYLKENRAIGPPENLDDLAIPEHIFRARRSELVSRGIAMTNPRFKKALFALTQRDFWTIIQKP